MTIPEIKNVFNKLKSSKDKFTPHHSQEGKDSKSKFIKNGEGFDLKKFQEKLSSDEVYLTNYLIFKAEYCDLEEEHVLDEINCCIKEIKIYNLKEKMNQTSLDIKEAEELKNKEQVDNLRQKFHKLAEELSELNI